MVALICVLIMNAVVVFDVDITCALDLRKFRKRVQHEDMCMVMKNDELSSLQ